MVFSSDFFAISSPASIVVRLLYYSEIIFLYKVSGNDFRWTKLQEFKNLSFVVIHCS